MQVNDWWNICVLQTNGMLKLNMSIVNFPWLCNSTAIIICICPPTDSTYKSLHVLHMITFQVEAGYRQTSWYVTYRGIYSLVKSNKFSDLKTYGRWNNTLVSQVSNVGRTLLQLLLSSVLHSYSDYVLLHLPEQDTEVWQGMLTPPRHLISIVVYPEVILCPFLWLELRDCLQSISLAELSFVSLPYKCNVNVSEPMVESGLQFVVHWLFSQLQSIVQPSKQSRRFSSYMFKVVSCFIFFNYKGIGREYRGADLKKNMLQNLYDRAKYYVCL
jgi:hypothetical protein